MSFRLTISEPPGGVEPESRMPREAVTGVVADAAIVGGVVLDFEEWRVDLGGCNAWLRYLRSLLNQSHQTLLKSYFVSANRGSANSCLDVLGRRSVEKIPNSRSLALVFMAYSTKS